MMRRSVWKRKYLFYYTTLYISRGHFHWTIVKKLDFVSYHVIKWIHGVKGLNEMANKSTIIDLNGQ